MLYRIKPQSIFWNVFYVHYDFNTVQYLQHKLTYLHFVSHKKLALQNFVPLHVDLLPQSHFNYNLQNVNRF